MAVTLCSSRRSIAIRELPRWSPDGQKIAFDYRPGNHSEIWVIDQEGRNPHQVVSGSYENAVPSAGLVMEEPFDLCGHIRWALKGTERANTRKTNRLPLFVPATG